MFASAAVISAATTPAAGNSAAIAGPAVAIG
jgi:hypothetical protein